MKVGAGEIDAKRRVAFDGFRARLPRSLGSEGRFARVGDRLRLAIPFPAGASIATPYFFPTTEGAIRYASPQSVTRSGDWLIVETDAAESPPSELHGVIKTGPRSEEHTSELQSLMRISYAVFCLKKK